MLNLKPFSGAESYQGSSV